MVSIHSYAIDEKKIWSHIGLVFAIAYMVIQTIVYFSELTVIVPLLFKGDIFNTVIAALGGVGISGTFLYSINGFGYGLMSLATLFAAPVFAGGKLERWVRWALTTHGVLAPVIISAVVYPVLIYIGAMWLLTFRLSTLLLAALLRRVSAQRNG